MNRRFVGRFVSVAHALAHYGVPNERARALIDRAGRAIGAEITLDPGPGSAAANNNVCVRIVRMKGHHAEVWEVPASAVSDGHKGGPA